MKKILKGLALTIPLFVAIGIEFAVAIYAIIIYYQVYFTHGIFSGLRNGEGGSNFTDLMANLPYPSDMVIEYMTYMMQIMWVVVFFFWYTNMAGRKAETGEKLLRIKHVVPIAILSLSFSAMTGGLVELILPHFETIAEQYSELMEMIFTGSPILVFISTIILAPLAEELIFRGVIMQKALRFSPFLVANILQALLFGIFHMNIVQGIYAFFGGLLMGYIAYKFKTIWASILVHMFFNGANYVLPSPTADWMFVAYAAAGAVITAGVLLLLRKTGVKQKTEEEYI